MPQSQKLLVAYVLQKQQEKYESANYLGSWR